MAGASWAALAFASCRSDSAVAFRSFATSAGCGWILLDAAQPIAHACRCEDLPRCQHGASGLNSGHLSVFQTHDKVKTQNLQEHLLAT